MGCCRYAWWTSVLMNGLANFFFFPFLSLNFSSFFFFSFLKKKFGEDLTKSWIVWIGLMIERDVMFVWIADFWIWQSVDVDEVNIVLKNWTFWFLYGFDEKLYLIFKIRVDILKIKDFVFFENLVKNCVEFLRYE